MQKQGLDQKAVADILGLPTIEINEAWFAKVKEIQSKLGLDQLDQDGLIRAGILDLIGQESSFGDMAARASKYKYWKNKQDTSASL